jgi:hypothetical protein
MGQHQKHVKDVEADRGHREEVDGDQLLGMILEKRVPRLRRRFAVAHHVFADAALTDVDAELEQLTVDPWCCRSPNRCVLNLKGFLPVWRERFGLGLQADSSTGERCSQQKT